MPRSVEMLNSAVDYTKGVNLLTQMCEVDPALPRQLNLKPGMPEDHVVGPVSVGLQRLWMAYCDILAAAKELVEKVRGLDNAHVVFHKKGRCNQRGCLGLMKELERAKEQALAAEHLALHASCAFWALATVELCIQDTDQELALRQGFVVVTTDDVEEDNPRELGAWLSDLTMS